MSDKTPLGLRQPWQWVQPHGTAEIKRRLLEARELRVHERERENMCSVAFGEIERLEREVAEARADAERWKYVEKHAQKVKVYTMPNWAGWRVTRYFVTFRGQQNSLRTAIDAAMKEER